MKNLWEYPEVIAYSQLLGASYMQWTGKPLLPGIDSDDAGFAKALYEAPFPLVSHGTEADPVFRYANRAALDLWQTDWEAFTSMPSRKSAQADYAIQSNRSQLLKRALEGGYVDDYSGIRISTQGQRFTIDDTTLWNVVDADGVRHGQAARIGRWTQITPEADRANGLCR
jgi:MEKHLA domain